jgi:uracil-DNA glycosylase
MMNGTESKKQLLKTLQNEMLLCNSCQLRKYGGQPMLGIGDINAKLFLIGEAPTVSAEKKGRPFVGGTGTAIEKWLEYLGLRTEEVFLSNAVKCVLRNPKGIARHDGYGPDGGELTGCKPWLIRELEIIKPEVILTVGWAAANSILGKSVSAFHAGGYCQKIRDQHYCAMHHPARHPKPMDDTDKKILDNIRTLLGGVDGGLQ